MEILKLIKTRRSVRRFKKQKVPAVLLQKSIEAAMWAPSGLNNQPWKFLVLDTAEKDELARFTHYGHTIKAAAALVLVFLDTQRMYDRDKDLMAIGACIENMLLYIHQKGYGACWLGQILKEKKKVCRQLAVEATLELAAAVAVGKPLSRAKKPRRRTKKQVMLSR